MCTKMTNLIKDNMLLVRSIMKIRYNVDLTSDDILPLLTNDEMEYYKSTGIEQLHEIMHEYKDHLTYIDNIKTPDLKPFYDKWDEFQMTEIIRYKILASKFNEIVVDTGLTVNYKSLFKEDSNETLNNIKSYLRKIISINASSPLEPKKCDYIILQDRHDKNEYCLLAKDGTSTDNYYTNILIRKSKDANGVLSACRLLFGKNYIYASSSYYLLFTCNDPNLLFMLNTIIDSYE